MKHLARYAFVAPVSGDNGGVSAAAVVDSIQAWLDWKGELENGGSSLTLRDGRVANINVRQVECSIGRVVEFVLTEPRSNGSFRTTIKVAETDKIVAVNVGLSAASEAIAPIYVDVRCPNIVRNLLAPPSPWNYEGTTLTSAPIDIRSESDAETFVERVWDSSRLVPIVAISDEHGSVLHPGIVERVARDLAGLAIVGRLAPQASWNLSKLKGREWSCYNGAIRLYWPRIYDDDLPYRHPLWTATKLLSSVPSTEKAEERIRRELRRRILGQSAFAVSDHPIFRDIWRTASKEEFEELQLQASEDTDHKKLADKYFLQAADAYERIDFLEGEIEELQSKVRGLQYALQSKSDDNQEVEPETETPPATVEDAILTAMEELGSELIFGPAVSDGVETLAETAGPPDKILRYLRVLGEFTLARRNDKLGKSAIKWLEDKGVTGSTESDTIKNSKKETEARTWDNGNGKRMFFEHHLKPSDSTAPERCVRIYFYYDTTVKKTIVGWVGRHP